VRTRKQLLRHGGHGKNLKGNHSALWKGHRGHVCDLEENGAGVLKFSGGMQVSDVEQAHRAQGTRPVELCRVLLVPATCIVIGSRASLQADVAKVESESSAATTENEHMGRGAPSDWIGMAERD
jgi:hypothetical protein